VSICRYPSSSAQRQDKQGDDGERKDHHRDSRLPFESIQGFLRASHHLRPVMFRTQHAVEPSPARIGASIGRSILSVCGGTESPDDETTFVSPEPRMTPRKLLRLVEIAQLLGVSKQRADQLRRRADFPLPVDRWARGDLWATADVRRWARTYSGGAARWVPGKPARLRAPREETSAP
jgi:prophage regulatory protein